MIPSSSLVPRLPSFFGSYMYVFFRVAAEKAGKPGDEATPVHSCTPAGKLAEEAITVRVDGQWDEAWVQPATSLCLEPRSRDDIKGQQGDEVDK